MPTPTYRVPVRVARGTLSALTAGISDLQEGEICYATDGNALYVVEGGVLTIAGSSASGDLVDDTTPQLGGSLDVNGNEIVSLTNENILVAPDGTGVLELRGNTGNDAAIQLNCETNGHGVKIQSPPHSAAASYTLVLPEDTGTTGQALTTDGAGVLSWATPSTVGSIGDLNDVSLGTESAVNYTSFDSGQTSFTDPHPSATGGAIDTTLGTNAWKVSSSDSYGDGSALVGFFSTDKRYDVVNLRIRSSNNIDTNNRLVLGGNRSELVVTGGGWGLYTRGSGFAFAGNNGFQEIGTKPTMLADTWYEITYVLDWGSAQRATSPNVSLWVDGAIAISNVTPTNAYIELTGVEAFNFRLPWSSSTLASSGDKYWDDISVATGDTVPWSMTASTITSPAALMNTEYAGTAVNDGAILQWVDANSSWEPAAAPSSPTTIDDLTDVDTSSVAPTDGQALVWSTTDSEWVPGDVAADLGATSINALSDVDTTTTSPTNDQVLAWNGTSWVPADAASGGGGGIAGTIIQKSETRTASSGAATFVELGASGIFVDITSSLDAWIVLYPTAADRTADAARAYGDDPVPGTGVLAEFYITAGSTVLASPGTTYFNNDTPGADALYAAVRDQSSANVDSQVTIKAYVHQNFNGTGTSRVTDSGTASSGALILTGMGQSGQLCTVTSSLDAWVALYGSTADLVADNARTFGTDPTPGSGVQAEFYVTAGTTVLATPGAMYFNNDTDPTDAMYLAVRDQAGASVDSLITVKVYAETNYTGISGGTFGSG